MPKVELLIFSFWTPHFFVKKSFIEIIHFIIIILDQLHYVKYAIIIKTHATSYDLGQMWQVRSALTVSK